MTLASFRRELYRSRFDSQRSWNGHALSSFQISSSKLYLDCPTDDLTSRQANGDINQRPQLCQANLGRISDFIRRWKSAAIFSQSCGRSDTKGRLKFPVLKPLDALRKRNGHYRDKNLLVNTFAAHNQEFILLAWGPRFQRRELDAYPTLGLP